MPPENTITLRRAGERGHADHGWLDSYHTFSFADYHDPQHMGFRSLRVINDDTVAPGKGFGAHPHNNMEIISYVVEGTLKHQDNTGNGLVIPQGQFQHITAGTGIVHSEFNPSDKAPVHFYQIWITPHTRGLEPAYHHLNPDSLRSQNGRKLIASPDGRDGSIRINQDAHLYLGELGQGQTAEYPLAADRGVWIQVVNGGLEVEREKLSTGDGLSVEGARTIAFKTTADSTLLIFDLA